MQNALQQLSLGEVDSLNQTQRQNLAQAIQGLSRQQLNWASGYLAGLSQAQIPQVAPQPKQPITILYASQTGNARSVANQLADEYKARGIDIKLISSADYRARDLGKEKYLLLVISTQGEGEAPESAFELQQYLFADSAPELKHLNYAVFGLGDSSYPDFCQAGRDFDQRLHELGAQRLIDRVDADVDFEDTATAWKQTVLKQSQEWLSLAGDNVVSLNLNSQATRYDRSNPLQATLLENRRITTEDAIADIHHLVIQIDSANLQYQPGDALGVWSRNDPALVNQILHILQLDGATQVQLKDQPISLQQALAEKFEITQLHPSLLKAWAEISRDAELTALISNNETLRQYSASHQFIDLIQQYPTTIDAAGLVTTLLPLQPRLYSISSSQLAYQDEVHLTVSTLQYPAASGELRYGSASHYLNQRSRANDVLRVYVAQNSSFRLPKNPDTPIIMIGAGTGIAPYRAFLQQREAEGARGDNWLFFGNRNFQRDFLYQVEWQKYRQSGLLKRVSLAFSRDQNARVYIQDRLFEEAEELYRWIQQGAHLYVCGSTELDLAVHQALLDIVQQLGSLNDEQAQQYLTNLRAEGRYLRDVY